ncbi:amidohydrolase family protein [Chloroflexota bacterium]
MFSDMVLFNGKVVSVDASESIAEAVAVKFGRILAVGSNEQIKSLIGSKTRVIDLKGRTVIPGLIESHCHISTAEGLQRAMGVIDASYEGGVSSLDDILAKIAEQAKKEAEGRMDKRCQRG